MRKLTDLERKTVWYIADLTATHLENSNMVRDQGQGQPLLWVIPQDDYVVLSVNPWRVKNVEVFLSRRFQHHLSTVLLGRRVKVSNTRGIYIQAAYWVEPRRELTSKPLDLSRQPSPLTVPIGVTAKHPDGLWLSVVGMDAVLIGGARRMGKTNLLHGWIAALLRGQEARLVLFDGKGGVEFARYRGAPRCQVIEDKLGPALGELFTEMSQRFDILKGARVANLDDYNKGRGAGARLERIVLIVDELACALQEPGVEDVLVDLAARGGAVGIHPVLATQRPSADVITPRLKGNLVTRIAFAVPDRASSFVVLDRSGAERIAKTPGRLLLLHSARIVEAQAFRAPDGWQVVSAGAASPGSDRRPVAAGPLSAREQRLVQAALKREGWFRVRELAAATGESRDWVNRVAQRWEALGWLTPVKTDTNGYRLGRQLMPPLLHAVGIE